MADASPNTIDGIVAAVSAAGGVAITAIFGAIGGWWQKRAEKAPDVQETLNKAISDVVAHYKDALDRSDNAARDLQGEVAELRRVVEEQTAQIEDMSLHIKRLESEITKLGGNVPPRKGRVHAGGVHA